MAKSGPICQKSWRTATKIPSVIVSKPPKVGRKRQRERFIEVSEGLQEEENQQNEELISIKKQLKSENNSETVPTLDNCLDGCSKAPENQPNDSLNIEKDQPKVDLNGNKNPLFSNNENNDNNNNPDQMNTLFSHMTALQNQFIYQEMR